MVVGTDRGGALADGLALVLLVALAVAVVLATSSLARGQIGRDSGVFLYAGQQILAGGIPYVDFWDHKGPVIYYLNALGLLVGGGSPLGVLFVGCVSLGAAGAIGYRLLRREFGFAPALVASAAWLLGSVLTRGDGNFTEEYALPFQFLALLLLAGAMGEPVRVVRLLAVGALGALAFLLKPSLVGIWLAAGLAVLLLGAVQRRWRVTLARLAALGGGAVGVLLLVAAWLAARGALADAIDQAIVYNAIYSRMNGSGLEAIDRHVAHAARVATIVLPMPLLAAGLLGWCAAAVSPAIGASRSFREAEADPPPRDGSGLHASQRPAGPPPVPDGASRGRPTSPAAASLPLLVVLIDAPIEFLLVALPGRGYEHYFLAWLPCLAVLTAFVVSLVERAADRLSAGDQGRIWRSLAVAVVAAVLTLGPGMSLVARLPVAASGLPQLDARLAAHESVRAIRDLSEPDDFVLIWGAEAGQNVASNRRSPTRYVYQYPLYTPGYQRADMATELLRDLRERRPRLILDTAETNFSIPPIDGPSREAWLKNRAPNSEFRSLVPPEMSEVFAYIQGHYRLERTFGHNWKVYRLTDDIVAPSEADPSVALDCHIGQGIVLRGYDLSRDRIAAGGKLTLTLYWEPLAIPERDYTVFVHLAGADGRPVAQRDGYPLGGRYPTGLWRPGEVIRDAVELTVPADASGTYRLLVGMYDPRTLERLPVGGTAGRTGDHVEAGRVTVER